MFLSQTVWRVCGFLCIVFGLPGHGLQIIIMLNKTNRKEPTSFYFVAIAICEFVYLIGILWIRLITLFFIRLDPRHILSCGIFYAIIIGPTSASNLLVASMFIDRSIMIVYPTRYRLLITRRHVLVRISLIILTVILIMIPHHFAFYYDPKSLSSFLCELHSCVRRWETILWPMMHAILFVLVPSLVVCISSIILLHNRCHHRRVHKQTLNVNARRMQTLSLLIVLFSFSGLIAILPVSILHVAVIHDQIVNQNANCSMRYIQYRILFNWFLSLMAINYSLKFYVRLTVSTPFRRDFARIIGCDRNDRQRRSLPLLYSSRIRNIVENKETIGRLT